ncbi:helix-turn-helix domain-containing protein, partial [Proteus mirabilis]
LALRAHRVVSKDHLLTIISPWDRDMTMNNVESLISRLRAKLAGQSSISTLRGFGYRLDDER